MKIFRITIQKRLRYQFIHENRLNKIVTKKKTFCFSFNLYNFIISFILQRLFIQMIKQIFILSQKKNPMYSIRKKNRYSESMGKSKKE